MRMALEIAVLLAAVDLGIYAIVGWRRTQRPVLDGLGLVVDRLAPADLGVGVLIAGLAMCTILAVQVGLHGTRVSDATGSGALAATAAGMLLTAFKEEFIMRGLLLSGLLRLLHGRAAVAIALSALAFGLIHLSNPGASVLSVTGNALGGAMYGIAFVLTRRLWLPVGLHFGWNFIQGPVLGFPVSGIGEGGLIHPVDLGPDWLTGGHYGPEAGLVGIASRFVIVAAVIGWVAWSRPGRLTGGPEAANRV